MDLLPSMLGIASIFSTLVAILTFVLMLRRDASTSIPRAGGMAFVALFGMFFGCMVLTVVFRAATNTPASPASGPSAPSRTDPTLTVPVVAKLAASTATLLPPTPVPSNTPVPTNTPAPPTLTPVPPTVTPVPSPTCEPGCVLYQENWSKGKNGWSTPQHWTITSQGALFDSAGGAQIVYAPYEPGKYNIADYAVEVSFQVLSVVPINGNPSCNYTPSFGVAVRMTDSGGYGGGVGFDWDFGRLYSTGLVWLRGEGCGMSGVPAAKAQAFTPGADEHTYRVEVRGYTVKLFIDDNLVAQGNDVHHLTGGRVGFWADGVQAVVKGFKVIKL